VQIYKKIKFYASVMYDNYEKYGWGSGRSVSCKRSIVGDFIKARRVSMPKEENRAKY
jgi:hypothetical protein